MSRWKALAYRLLFPPGWFVLLISLAGYGGLFEVDFSEQPQGPVYVIFALSAYALIVDIAALPRLKVWVKSCAAKACQHSRVLRRIRKTPFGRKYLGDRAFRAKVSLYQGMAVNFLYTVFRAVMGIKYVSAWFISMAAYYFLLGVLRAYLVFCYRHRPAEPLAYEYRCYKTLGKLLLLLNIPMSGMVALVVFENSGLVYPGVVIYVSALYTFYMAVLSAVNLWKIRKVNSPILAAAKGLHVISAAMSVMGLQTAMITRFGQGDSDFRIRMNSITGSGVCVLVLGLSVYMIANARKRLRKAESI